MKPKGIVQQLVDALPGCHCGKPALYEGLMGYEDPRCEEHQVDPSERRGAKLPWADELQAVIASLDRD